jgi:NDP-4-keto-2,6-dideoxyhexose 3-C-methyltransferase
MNLSTKLSTCLICGSDKLIQVVSLGNQPLSGVFPGPHEPDPPSTPLNLMFCNSVINEIPCRNVQLSHVANLESMYGANYGYNSSLSNKMLLHLKHLADSIIEIANINSDDYILDIGCNDGSLLNMFSSLSSNLIGVDPSGEKFRHLMNPEIKFFPEFFPSKNLNEFMGGKSFKLVTSIAMFYDLLQPLDFALSIYEILEENGLWVVELAEMTKFLSNLSYDQICHEHVLYYDSNQMINMASKAGFKLEKISFNGMNGGSACYYFRKSDKTEHLRTPMLSIEHYHQLNWRIQANKFDIRSIINLVKNNNMKIFGYGASTKGNVLANFTEISKDDMPFISDANKFKWGRQTPGTRIPIISHTEMRKFNPDYLFVFIWHLRDEVINNEIDYLKQGGKLIFPLPRPVIVDYENYQLYLSNNFDDVAFKIGKDTSH